MRIHTDTLTELDVMRAATTARVTLDRFVRKGSKSRDHAFDLTLQGESRRHQNGGDGKAATWDQWGVFLSALFAADENLTIPRAYRDVEQFDFRTMHRFDAPGVFPADYHGDHRFEFAGVPYMQSCKKCTASYRWQ